MYVCVCVCIYFCRYVYVCMYVGMYICMYVHMYESELKWFFIPVFFFACYCILCNVCCYVCWLHPPVLNRTAILQVDTTSHVGSM